MEDKIIELLRKNRIGEEKAIYLAHELLFLFSVVGRSEQFICRDCGKDTTEWLDGICEDCTLKGFK